MKYFFVFLGGGSFFFNKKRNKTVKNVSETFLLKSRFKHSQTLFRAVLILDDSRVDMCRLRPLSGVLVVDAVMTFLEFSSRKSRKGFFRGYIVELKCPDPKTSVLHFALPGLKPNIRLKNSKVSQFEESFFTFYY